MSGVELAACPFCGGKAEIEQFGNTRVSTIYACGECGCRLETGEEFNHGRAWNRRAVPMEAVAWRYRLPGTDGWIHAGEDGANVVSAMRDRPNLYEVQALALIPQAEDQETVK